jgi:NAD(P)-dependent dehydrogenase (short-subunit alcohol dehydrogenase family)
MPKTIVIVGYGPGISHAVAEKFGAEGFSVAIGARKPDALQAGARKLEAKGIKVLAVPTDASDAKAVRAFLQKARSQLGSIDVVHWNAAANLAGDLLGAPTDELVAAFNTGVTGLVACIQEALPELKKAKDPAVLVTDGGFGLTIDEVDDAVVQYQAMGLAIANAAKHKAVRILSRRLRREGVYLGEVMVMGTVKGTAFDHGDGTVELKSVQDALFKLYRERKDVTVQVR